MKKIVMTFLCLLLIAALATSAFAAGSASFSMAASVNSLHRGDTVTLTVSVSCNEPANSYGLQLSYDTSVFELVSGSTNVSGALLNSFKNGFAFMFQTATAYSGSVGTVTLKVKDNAAFGSYTISGTASVKNGSTAITASGCSRTVTVACNHSYGSWSDAGNGKHSRTCSICLDPQTADHTWNSGTVTKQATCKEEGVKTYTCTACNAAKTEKLAKTNTHKYGSWAKVNDTTHKHTCTVCQKEETASHTWNSGTVTKQATCKEEGVKTYTCAGCGAVKTEQLVRLTTHTYDHACDTDCNVCGAIRTTTHSYKSAWSKDKTNHWHECSACKDKKDVAAHTPGAEATETKAQTCSACGYVIKAALGHKHSYAAVWTMDESGHWYACSGCEEKDSYVLHDFENACDPDCSICGYIRETAHAFGETWDTDGNNHWHTCSGCALKQDKAVHEPGAEATATTAQTCTICGYEIVPALGAEENTDGTDAPDVTEANDVTEAEDPVGQDGPAAGDFLWWIVIAVAVVVIAVAIIIVVIEKMKK